MSGNAIVDLSVSRKPMLEERNVRHVFKRLLEKANL